MAVLQLKRSTKPSEERIKSCVHFNLYRNKSVCSKSTEEGRTRKHGGIEYLLSSVSPREKLSQGIKCNTEAYTNNPKENRTHRRTTTYGGRIWEGQFQNWDGKMTDWVKVLTSKSSDVSLTPRIPRMWKERANIFKLSSDHHTCALANTCIHTCQRGFE